MADAALLYEEGLLTLTEAAKLKTLPSRGGKRPSLNTVWRWAMKGIKGVKLETVRVGNAWCTSEPAVVRFIERLTAAYRGEPVVAAGRTPSQRAKDIRATTAQLVKAGIIPAAAETPEVAHV